MKNDNLIFIREETPLDGRTISFYYNKNKDTVIVLDSQYPDKHIEKSFKPRKGKCDAINYSLRLDGSGNNCRKFFISRESLFQIVVSEKELYNRWNLQKFILDVDTIKKYLMSEYVSKGLQVPSFTILGYSENSTIERAIYSFCYTNGDGSSTYYKILEEMGIDGDVIYRTHTGKTLRSYAEFVLFSFLHYNNINFEYEADNISGCIPDFKLNDNLYLELIGYDKTSKSSHAQVYHERLTKKTLKYSNNGIEVFYLDITQHKNPKDSVYEQLVTIYPNLKIPNIFDYFQKYAYSGDKYVQHLKDLARRFSKGEIDSNYLLKHNQQDYLKILDEYSSVYDFCETFMSLDELVNTPKSYGYFYTLENCHKWLKFLEDTYGHLPSTTECKSDGKFSPLYSIYRIYKTNEFKNGGLFSKYNSPYKDIPMEIIQVIHNQTGNTFDGIYDAYIKTNCTTPIGLFYDEINRKERNSEFTSTVSCGRRIKNTITNTIYQSIRECCEVEGINPAGFEVYIRKLYKGKVFKSKYSHLVSLIANYGKVDDENYIMNRYESVTKFNDKEVKTIHNMIKKSHTEKEISKKIGKSFSRNVFYKSLVYQIKIKEIFNEDINENNINTLYPPKVSRTDFTIDEIKKMLTLSFSVASEEFNISIGTYYNIKNKNGKYSKMDY